MAASKWSPETRGAILERTSAGVSLVDACRALDLRHSTVKKWLARGRREGSGEFFDFAIAVEEARESASSRPDPMDADELAQVVSEMAHKGSVTAAKLRWEMLRNTSDPDDPDEFDELKARRRAS